MDKTGKRANHLRDDHFTDLDGMRGILACLVMLTHYGFDRIIAGVTHGFLERCQWDLSVDFFFVLSGFVLARSFQRRPPSWREYAVKRVCRLAPMFLIALIAVIICGIPFDSSTVISNFLIVQSIFGFDSLNYPSWSVPFELFLPALAPYALRLWRSCNIQIIEVIFAGFLLGGMFSAYTLAIGSDHRLVRAFTGLGLGLVLYRLTAQKLAEWRGSPIAVVAIFVAIVVVMLTAHQFPFASLAFHPLVVVMVAAGATAHSIFSTRPCQALGCWSYSIYLLHIPVLMVSTKALGTDVVGRNPALKLVLAMATIGLAAASYRFVERPALSLVGRMRGEPRRQAGANAS